MDTIHQLSGWWLRYFGVFGLVVTPFLVPASDAELDEPTLFNPEIQSSEMGTVRSHGLTPYRVWFYRVNPVLQGDSVGKPILGLRGFGAGCIGFRCFR